MKLIKRDLSFSDKEVIGQVTVIPEESEDMWHAYNMISRGDYVTASTMRKVVQETSTGSSNSHRVHTKVTIKVETIDFDTTACHLRLKGRNAVENKFIKMHAYHTLDLELNRTFTLNKPSWDIVVLERLELACDPGKSADVGAIVMQEGIANLCLVTSSMTTVRARIDMNVPRKRRGNCSQHDKGLQRFYDAILQAMLRHFDFSILKCIVIASPGFVKDQFYEFMYAEAVRTDNKLLFENKPKFVLVHSSSGHKFALNEVLQDSAVAAKLADTKAAGEVKALNSFFQMLQNEQERAFYGIKHVELAARRQAIDLLLVTDALFRANDVAVRRRYVKLIEDVKEYGGDVKIFSSLHVSGERLGEMTGVAAILRFPLPELEEVDNSDSDSDGDNDTSTDGPSRSASAYASGAASSSAATSGNGAASSCNGHSADALAAEASSSLSCPASRPRSVSPAKAIVPPAE